MNFTTFTGTIGSRARVRATWKAIYRERARALDHLETRERERGRIEGRPYTGRSHGCTLCVVAPRRSRSAPLTRALALVNCAITTPREYRSSFKRHSRQSRSGGRPTLMRTARSCRTFLISHDAPRRELARMRARARAVSPSLKIRFRQ